MQTKQHSILKLIRAITDYLQNHKQRASGIKLVLSKLESMDLSADQLCDVAPVASRHDAILDKAIEGISAAELNDIAANLKAAKRHLVWQEDNAKYYQSGADLGEGYRNCNLHSLLIGPGGCAFEHPDFSLGIFMLGPRTLYRDHRHAAPELYLNLSTESHWRFQGGDWQAYPAGSFIWNDPQEEHATMVHQQPFISVFIWLKDIHAPCEVVFKEDWHQIEAMLAGL